jgi:ABC-2 type transport system ATP-binding protein
VDVSTHESLLIHRRIYALGATEFRRSVDELTDLLEVGRVLHVPVRKLSLGERMRCELLLALLHRPALLFADEPTVGLDVVAKARVRGFLGSVNRELGTTIVLTSHDMDDVQALCGRVAVITSGSVVFDGDLRVLRERVRPAARGRTGLRGPRPSGPGPGLAAAGP